MNSREDLGLRKAWVDLGLYLKLMLKKKRGGRGEDREEEE